jgi:hypothetical protein
MYWYVLSFPRTESRLRVVSLAQQFLDARMQDATKQLALFRKKPSSPDEPIIYYLGGDQRMVERIARQFNAVECLPPRAGAVEHFGGDALELSHTAE